VSKIKRYFFLSKKKRALERESCALEKKRFSWKKREREREREREFMFTDISQLDEDGQEYVHRCKKVILEDRIGTLCLLVLLLL
jgi:hypothetical protein